MEYQLRRDEVLCGKRMRVRFAESKPNYGMRDLDPVLEELTGNKLELVGPLLTPN